jgi:antitoxin CptB
MNELLKLKWRCRRGMRELDVLLTAYLEKLYKQAPITEQQTFKTLLELSDNELQSYLLGKVKPEDQKILELVLKIVEKNYRD